ncbi:PAS domain S-box protein [bacterium]|nr:PAS domain S-box protein [bacterium]
MNENPRVLIVEDEAIIAQDLKATLMNLDYEVIDTVSSGRKALEVLEKETIHVILMDIRIKGDLNGIETTDLINARFQVPVIFLTAYADAKTMDRIKRTDAYGFLVKPASEQAIQGSIDLALYKHNLSRKLREREEKLEHLNQVLLAIRNVNQLITTEKDVNRLLQGACDNLIESLGYKRAWIALFEGSDTFSTFVNAGFETSPASFEKVLKGDPAQYPDCVRRALGNHHVVIVDDPQSGCERCALQLSDDTFSRFSMRLSYGGQIYGIMSVAVPSAYVKDQEEQDLFRELVDDVAFAIYRLELEVKRQYAETMLKTRERTLSTLMSNLPGMAYRRLNDDDWTMKFVSNGCKKLTGYHPIELINNKKLTFQSIVHPDDRDSLRAIMTKPGTRSGQFEVTYRIITFDHQIKWVWESGSFIGEMEEGCEILEGVIHDITDRIGAEEAYKHEKEFTDTALNAQSDTFFVFDPQTHRALRWNRTFEKISGYTGEEIKKIKAPDHYYDASDLKKVAEASEKLMRSGHVKFEVSLITKEGRRIPFEYQGSLVQDPVSGNAVMVSVGRDVTERKEAESALKESEQRLRNIIDHSNEIFYMHDLDHRIYYVSAQCEKIMGFMTDEMKRKWTDLITDHPMNRQAMNLKVKAIRTGERQPPYPVEVRKKTGEPVFMEIDESPLKNEAGTVVGMVGAIRDIHERRKAELALRASEVKYRALIENMTDSVFLIDRQNRVVSVNRFAAHFLNKKPEELIDRHIRDLFPRDLAKKYETSIKTVFKNGEPLLIERQTIAGNRSIWLAASLSPIKDETGNVTGVIGVSRNITERKQMEEALIRSEARYRAIVNDQTEFIIRWLPNGTRTYVNPAYCRYYGKSYEDLVGGNLFDNIHAKDRVRIKSKIKSLTPEHPVATDEHRRIMPDGALRWHLWTDRAIFDDNGKIREIQSVGRDITQRKQTEMILYQTNVRMKAILENTDEFIMIADKSGKPIMYNSAYARIMKELIGFEVKPGILPHKTLSDQKAVRWWDSLHRRVLHGEKFSAEFSFADREGNLRFFDIHYYPIVEENEVRGFTEYTREITDRKNAEEALKKSEALLKKIAENFPHSYVSIINRDLTIGFTSGQEFKRQGLDPDAYFGLTLEDVFGDKASLVREKYLRTFQGEEMVFELCINSQHQLYNTVPLFNDHGKIDRILCVVENITDRKRSEEALLESLEELNETQRIARLGSWVILFPGKEFRWSEGVFRIFGLDPKQPEPSIDRFLGMVHPDDLPQVQKMIKKQMRRFEGMIQTVYRICLKDGSIRYLNHIAKQVRSNTGKVIRVHTMVQDITEHKRIQMELQEEKERTRQYLDVAGNMFVVIQRNMSISLINQRGCDILGYSQNHLIGKNWFDTCVPPQNRSAVKRVFRQLIRDQVEPAEYYHNTVLTKAGEERLIAWHNTVLRDDEGRIVATLSSGEDITEKDRVEKALKEGNERYRRFTEAAFEGIGISRQGKLVDVNQQLLDIYGYTYDEIIKVGLPALIHTDDREKVFNAMKKRVKAPYEHRGIRKDGSILHLEIRASYITIDGLEYRFTVIRNVTERKKAESALKQKMEELERFNKAMVGREKRMIELKQEANRLYIQLGQRKKYRVPDEE